MKGQGLHTQPERRVYTRLGEVMAHIPWYAFKGQARLAADAGVSKSAVSRLLSGQCLPSFALVAAITKALSRRTRFAFNPLDLISFDGTYPTPSVCTLMNCRGCLPDKAWNADDTQKPEYRYVKPGTWDSSANNEEAA